MARRLSPVMPSVCAQDQLEPILLDYARSFSDGEVQFGFVKAEARTE